MAEAQLLLKLEIIALDQPAQFGEMHEPFNRSVDGQAREPEFDGSRLVFRPFDEQPLLGPGLTAPGIAVGRADPGGGRGVGTDVRSGSVADLPPARVAGAGVIHAKVGLKRKRCALVTGNTAISTWRPPLGPLSGASGALYLRAATSELRWRAKMATLMARTGGHPGNVG